MAKHLRQVNKEKFRKLRTLLDIWSEIRAVQLPLTEELVREFIAHPKNGKNNLKAMRDVISVIDELDLMEHRDSHGGSLKDPIFD